jgi:alkylation response protein AidB-like acyl-CoA dehydrogenase
LTDELLTTFAERAPVYDHEHRFFEEDFVDLRDAGFLRIAIPPEFGGSGLSLAETMRELRRLAYHAAPTALGINMHLYWTGVFADCWRRGDATAEPFLQDVASGEVFGAGHSESGNDLGILASMTRAERVAGGYRFHGRKAFVSLGPVWTRLGLHGLDASDPTAPRIVHAFLQREAVGYEVLDNWDVMGMRATQSDDIVLDGAFVPDRYIWRVVPAGAAGVDESILSVYAWALLGFANTYFGLAQRVLAMAIETLKRRRSVGLTRSMAYHPEAQHELAEMAFEIESIEPHLEKVAEDWSTGVGHGRHWALKLAAAKYHAVEGSWRAVDKAMDLFGGSGVFRSGGLERLWRDARLGRIHPINSARAHEFVAKSLLGIGADEQPRWG